MSILVKNNIIAYKEAVEVMQKTKKSGNRNDSMFRKNIFRVIYSFITPSNFIAMPHFSPFNVNILPWFPLRTSVIQIKVALCNRGS